MAHSTMDTPNFLDGMRLLVRTMLAVFFFDDFSANSKQILAETLSYNVVFKCLLILGPKCYFGSELRYSNEITLYQRNLAFRSEMSHFASEWIIMRPNGWFRTHNGHFGPIMAHFGPIIGMV